MATQILAVDDNQVNLKVVSAALTHAGYEVITATSGAQALSLMAATIPDLVILDISMPEMDGYEVCRRLRANPATAHLPVIMLTAHESIEEKIKGFEVGADDYLTKPFQPVELQARVKVLIRRAAPVVEKKVNNECKVLSVFSLRGGVGVTSIATNLACGLARIWGKEVTLMDLALTMGQAALMLNLPLRHTWADLAGMKPEEIDFDILNSIYLKHESGVSVLAAPSKVEQNELITLELVNRVIKLVKEQANYLVIDMPHDFRDTTLAALDQSDEYIAIMAPELASVRAMAGMLDVFDRLKYDRSKLHIILNWTFERKGLARKDIENVLHHPIQLVMPFAPETFISGINLGIPPIIGAQDSPIAALFEDFAFGLSAVEDQNTKPVNPSETWSKVANRVAARQKK
jgi:pilus assembly protein CpaE